MVPLGEKHYFLKKIKIILYGNYLGLIAPSFYWVINQINAVNSNHGNGDVLINSIPITANYRINKVCNSIS